MEKKTAQQSFGAEGAKNFTDGSMNIQLRYGYRMAEEYSLGVALDQGFLVRATLNGNSTDRRFGFQCGMLVPLKTQKLGTSTLIENPFFVNFTLNS